MFRRKVTEELRNWKEKYSGRYSVLFQDARRVGKSTIAENFASNILRVYQEGYYFHKKICQMLKC